MEMTSGRGRSTLVVLAAALLSAVPSVGLAFSGTLWTEFENGYLSSSGTLCDTKPIQMIDLDWEQKLGEYGRLWGYGCFLGTLHDEQREYHNAWMNEFESGVFYGYDWKLSDEFTFSQSAGGIWNPLYGYYGENNATLWEYRYFQSLENPYLTPFWDVLGLISPTPSWARVRLGVRRSFALTPTLVLTPSVETVWADRDRFYARYGELPVHRFLGGAFVSTTVALKLEWFFAENWSCWAKVRQFDTIDPQARRCEKKKPVYWAKPDFTLFTLGLGYHF